MRVIIRRSSFREPLRAVRRSNDGEMVCRTAFIAFDALGLLNADVWQLPVLPETLALNF